MAADSDWGQVKIMLGQAMRMKHMNAETLARRANIARGQLEHYLHDELRRLDLHELARIMTVLQCEINDVLCYIPPSDNSNASEGNAPDVPSLHERTYSTGEMAKLGAVHPNTIRFYEDIGILSKALRAPNGYRIFTYRHLIQLKVCRVIYSAPYTNSRLRRMAFQVVLALKEWDLALALSRAREYKGIVQQEYEAALMTASLVGNWARGGPIPDDGVIYTRREVSKILGVTMEALRNWERNGLIEVPRTGPNHTRYYTSGELARLRIIYMLRQNGYSIAAIYRSLSAHDRGNGIGSVLALNQPGHDEEAVYVNAGDHWLNVLSIIADHAERIIEIIEDIQA